MAAALQPSKWELSYVTGLIREFLASRGAVETLCQSRLTILAACEDHKTIVTKTLGGKKWPLIQSNQMNLEYDIIELAEAKKASGADTPTVVYCLTTSTRDEPDPNPDRHLLQFDMIEIELLGDMTNLRTFQEDLLEYLGFDRKSFVTADYLDMCVKYGVSELTHAEEARLRDDYGPVVFLCNFPRSSDPYWNMRYECEGGEYDPSPNATARKIDVIIGGRESIGSAERSNCPDLMRRGFYSVDGGRYAQTLFEHFGQDRVIAELDTYLSMKFVPRCGMGIGMARLIMAMRELGIKTTV